LTWLKVLLLSTWIWSSSSSYILWLITLFNRRRRKRSYIILFYSTCSFVSIILLFSLSLFSLLSLILFNSLYHFYLLFSLSLSLSLFLSPSNTRTQHTSHVEIRFRRRFHNTTCLQMLFLSFHLAFTWRGDLNPLQRIASPRCSSLNQEASNLPFCYCFVNFLKYFFHEFWNSIYNLDINSNKTTLYLCTLIITKK